jgi:hypothetical protein
MKWLGYKQVPVKSVIVPAAEIKARTKHRHVAELAASATELGDEYANAPTVRVVGDKRLLTAGRDRWAAAILRKAPQIWVHLFEGTDLEASDVEDDENIHRRRDDRDELIARKVARREAAIDPDDDELPVTVSGKPGRHKTAKGLARDQVARELGTTAEAVRAAENRATTKKRAPTADEIKGKPLEPPVELWGIPIPEAMPNYEFQYVTNAQSALDAADKALRAAQAALTKLAECGIIGQRLAALVRDDVHGAGASVRRLRPAALCPYCKGIAERRAKCTGCQGIGYVGSEALEGIAPELKQRGADAMVFDGGRLIPIAKARDTKPRSIAPQPKPSASAKKMRIEDEQGNDLRPVAESDEDLVF